MNETSSSAHSDSNRDIAWAVISGSIRFVLPTICFVLLYFVILRTWGTEIFGLWSLVAAAQSFLALGEIGLGQMLAREAGPDLSERERQSVIADRNSAGWLYVAITMVLLVVLVLAFPVIQVPHHVHSDTGMFAALAVSIVAAGIKQYARLDLSLASAHGAVARTVRLQGYSQAVLLAIAFASSTTFPIEGLAAGFLVSGIFDLVAARRLARKVGAISANAAPVTFAGSLQRIAQMVGRGRYMYLSTIGSAIREPLYRFIIASFFGLSMAGYFDIAVRTTKTAREIGVFGLSSTFPYFARHYRQGHVEQSRQLIRWTLSLSLALGTLPLAAFVALCRPIYHLWIGDADDTLVNTTIMLSFWLWMTLLNVPFWYAALASDMDKKAAASILVHTASVVSLVALVPLGLNYYGTLIVWVVGSSLSQVSIIYLISSKLGGSGIFGRRVYWQVVFSLALILAAAAVAFFGVTSQFTVAEVAAGLGAISFPALFMLVAARSDLAKLMRLMRGLPE